MYNPEGKKFAAGSFDGSINIYCALTNRLLKKMSVEGATRGSIVSLRWSPKLSKDHRDPSILTAVQSDGYIQHFNAHRNEVVAAISDQLNTGNNLTCSDYVSDGLTFAVGGKNRKVYLYDMETQKQTAEIYKNGLSKIQTHSNRMLSLKAHPEDNNLLISSGWDSTIKIYDIRGKAPVASIVTGIMCGDALDIFGDMVVAGSY